jgi:hypothetical protein
MYDECRRPDRAPPVWISDLKKIKKPALTRGAPVLKRVTIIPEPWQDRDAYTPGKKIIFRNFS